MPPHIALPSLARLKSFLTESRNQNLLMYCCPAEMKQICQWFYSSTFISLTSYALSQALAGFQIQKHLQCCQICRPVAIKQPWQHKNPPKSCLSQFCLKSSSLTGNEAATVRFKKSAAHRSLSFWKSSFPCIFLHICNRNSILSALHFSGNKLPLLHIEVCVCVCVCTVCVYTQIQ